MVSPDLKKFESFFIPPAYTEEIFAFIQNSVCRKEEISRKVTGEGLIAITNWHLLRRGERRVWRKHLWKILPRF